MLTMPGCSAVYCTNSTQKGYLMRKFPKDPTRRKQWLINMRRDKWTPSDHACLCEVHFTPEMWERTREDGTRKLRINAVPTIFSFEEPVKTRNKPRKRSESRRRKILKKTAPSVSTYAGEIRVEGTTLEYLAINVNQLKCEKDPIDVTEQTSEYNLDIVKEEPEAMDVIECLDIVKTKPEAVEDVSVGTQKDFQFFSIENFRTNDKAVCFYTGLDTYDKFKFVFHTLCPEAYSINNRYSHTVHLSVEDQLFLTLTKLKQNKEDFELSLLFNLSETLVNIVFRTWVNFLCQMWNMLDAWPSRKLISLYMSDAIEESTETSGVSTSVCQVMNDNVDKMVDLTKIFKILQIPVGRCYRGIVDKIYGCCYTLRNFNEEVVSSSK